jgi:hypothetical protein
MFMTSRSNLDRSTTAGSPQSGQASSVSKVRSLSSWGTGVVMGWPSSFTGNAIPRCLGKQTTSTDWQFPGTRAVIGTGDDVRRIRPETV